MFIVLQLQGSGPWGLPLPNEVQPLVAQVQAAAAGVMPRLRLLMDKPGALEIRAELQEGLTKRFAARAVKFLMGGLGSQQQPASIAAGSSTSRMSALGTPGGS